MKKDYLIIILVVAVLILAGVVTWIFLQKQEVVPPAVPPEEVIPAGAEEKFYSYLELASRSGKFLEFDEAKSEIKILCLDTETMKIATESFKIDEETVFSKMSPDLYQPDIFPRKELTKIKQEAQITVFYLLPEKENEIPLARLIQVEASF